MQKSITKVVIAVSLMLFPALLFAQETASITGLVTDSTGAVIAGANISLVDTRTNTSYSATSSSIGVYAISKVHPGPGYKITVTKEGFSTVVINELYIAVASTRTQNIQMSVGAKGETVEVSAISQGVALDTTDATVGNSFSMIAVSQLPVQMRDNPAALLQLQPGVVNATGGSDGLSSRAGSVTGARGDQNNVTLDGLDVNDFATGQAFSTVANAPIDSIQEFRGETAGSLSAAGRGSGGQIQMVTKSGTNQFHGSAAEYHRNTVFAANEWFNNNSNIKKAPLLRNQFGATLGGPIKKDKLFFFFDYNARRDAYSQTVSTTVPLDSFRQGNISYIKNASGCLPSSRANTTPACIGTLNAAAIAALDPKHVGFDPALLKFISSRYPQANDLTLGDGVNTGGFRFNAPVHRTENDYVSRIDYNMNSSMKLFGRFSILRDRYGDSVNYTPIQFPGDPLTKTIANTSYAYVIGHTWTINPTMVNQFTYGKTVSRLAFPTNWNPLGTTKWSFGGLTLPYTNQNSQARSQPIPTFRDDFTWQRGNHNIQIGGTFKPILTTNALTSDYNTVTVGLGGLTGSLNPALQPLDILTIDPSTGKASITATTAWDTMFAFGLGRIASVSSNWNYDNTQTVLPQGTGSIRNYRYNEFETYISDTWKVNSALTLTYGLRYNYYSVPYEVNGAEAIQNYGFDEYFSQRVSQGLAGISGNSAVPIIYYDLGGAANPGAKGLYKTNRRDFAPRLSFAYSPSTSGWLGRILGDKKTVIRGGSGVFFDHPVTNALNFIQNQNTYMFQSSSAVNFGNTAPDVALLNDPRFTSIDSIPTPAAAPAITHPFAPYVNSSGAPTGTASGRSNYAIDPHLKTPYSMVFNFGIQRELPHHFLLESTYVGRLGRRLIAQADASQLVDFKDPVSGQMLSAAFADLTQQVRAGKTYKTITPVPFFENQVPKVNAGGTIGILTGSQVLAYYKTNLVNIGDIADAIQWLKANGIVNSNIGLPPQFALDTFITNKGSSNYHGLLTTLHRNFANGLQFDLNYTMSHSIDNASMIANSIAGNSGIGFLCDARDLRVCRSNSDFDITHIVNGNFLFDLPFGKGKAFLNTSPGWLNQIVGGWNISGIPTWRSGIAFTTITSAYLMGYANNSPGIFNGDASAVQTDVHKLADGTVNLFADPVKAQGAYSFPTGFTVGNRNNLRGPGYFNLDLGVGKRFPVTERLNIQFRADAFNALNHPSFGLPGGGSNGSGANITTTNVFGKITTTSSTARVVQFGLRVEF